MGRLSYSDKYFKYLFTLMKYGADVKKRRIRANIFIYLEYEEVKFAVINDKQKSKLICFVYIKDNKGLFQPNGQINLYGYYPRQVRKIFYDLKNKITENRNGIRENLLRETLIISRTKNFVYKKFIK